MKENKPQEKTVQNHPHRGNLFGAFLFISLGIILLLNNFNALPWGVWEILWRFWPVLLVIWGLEMVLGHGFIGNLLVSILGIMILFLVVSFAVSRFNPDYNNFMFKNFPGIWKYLDQQIPYGNFRNQKGKVFRCNPMDGSCEVIYR